MQSVSKESKSKVVRSEDVMKALHDLFNSLGRGTSSNSDIGIRVYGALSKVPEFYAAELTETEAETQ